MSLDLIFFFFTCHYIYEFWIFLLLDLISLQLMYFLKVNATCPKNETQPTLENILSLFSALLENPRVRTIRTEVLVLLTAVMYLFVGILGSQRRRSTSWFIQKVVFVAHTLSFPLGAYTLGSMQSHSAVGSSMYAIWAPSLLILHSCTDTSYRLDDIKQVRRFYYRWILYCANVLVTLTTLNMELRVLP